MRIQETVREDGLRIITGNMPHLKKVYVEISAGVGSAHDPHLKEGLFHFFEHMAYKGTPTRDLPSILQFSYRNLLENNACTEMHATRYYGQAVYTKVGLLTEFLCDMFFRSLFPINELNREREVVENEIAMNNDDDNMVAYFALSKTLWAKNPLRKSSLGTSKTLARVTQEDLLCEQKKWYVPSNTVVLALGHVDHTQIVQLVNSNVPINHSPVIHPVWDEELETLPKTRQTIIHKPNREKATILFGRKLPKVKDEKTNLIIKMLSHILASGFGSLLWDELREKRGLVYGVSGGLRAEYPLGCSFEIYAQTLPRRVNEVQHIIWNVLSKPLTNQSFFNDTQEIFSDHYTIGSSNVEQWANAIHQYIALDKPLDQLQYHLQKMKHLLRKISLEDLEAMRQHIFQPEQFATVIVQ